MFNAVKEYFEKSWLLIVSAFIFGLLLAMTNSAWSGKIEQNKTGKLNGLMSRLITNAESFENVIPGMQVEWAKNKFASTDIYKAVAGGQTVGFCFKAQGTGFADKIELVIAVDAAFEKIIGFNVLTSSETPGFGDKISHSFYNDQYKGAPAGTLTLTKKGDDKIIDSEIVAISGATVSSTAVVTIFNHYVESVKQQLKEKGIIQ
jgi:electron transport complex protein RnfG